MTENITCTFCGSDNFEDNIYKNLAHNPYHCIDCGHAFGKSQPQTQTQTRRNTSLNNHGLSQDEINQIKSMSPEQKQQMISHINADLAQSSDLVIDAQIRSGEINPLQVRGSQESLLETDAGKRREAEISKRTLKETRKSMPKDRRHPGEP